MTPTHPNPCRRGLPGRARGREFDPVELADEVVGTLWPLARLEGLRLQLHAPQSPCPRLSGDPAAVRRLLAEMIGQAIAQTRSGCVDVSLRTESVGNDWVTLRLCVDDTGGGIAPERLPGLFGGQTALPADGLAECRRQVAALGGSLRLHSTAGVGKTLGASLRLTEAGCPPLAAAGRSARSR